MLTEKTFKAAGASKCQFEISHAKVRDKLTVEFDLDHDGAYLLANEDGYPVGYLSARHWVSIDREAGRSVLHASVNGIGEDKDGNSTLTVRVVTGDTGDVYTPPPEIERRVYRANVVGESYRQPAIAKAKVGEPIRFLHDVNNAYDARAIMVVTPRDEQIGFLPRDGWLTRALLDEERGYEASIAEIHPRSSDRPHLSVVLEVSLT